MGARRGPRPLCGHPVASGGVPNSAESCGKFVAELQATKEAINFHGNSIQKWVQAAVEKDCRS